MKSILFFITIFYSSFIFSRPIKVPSEYLFENSSSEKALSSIETINFSRDVDHLLNLQENTLNKINGNSERAHLTQLLTSFSLSQSGLFGLSAFSSQSSTTLFWEKKQLPLKDEEVKSFHLTENDDEISLQMKIDEVTDYLVSEDKVKDSPKLRYNLDKVLRKGHQMFTDFQGIESANWKVGGYRLDLSISASGNVTPFVKLGENVRLWIEWTKSSPNKSSFQVSSRAGEFISNVLADIDVSSSQINHSSFELQNVFIGLGEDIKTGLFGFGASAFGFTGYVKLVRKEKHENSMIPITVNKDMDYPVVSGESNQKSRSPLISRKRLMRGVTKSLHFAKFFTDKASRVSTSKWKISSIRQIATVSRTGFFGLSNMSTRGVFIFIFNRKKPDNEKLFNSNIFESHPTLIRLSFMSVIGFTIPEIANLEIRPQVELFWK